MRIREGIVFLSVGILLACETKLSVEQIVERAMAASAGPAELPAPQGTEMAVSALFSQDASMGRPYLMRTIGGVLLVADASPGPPLHLFNLRSGQLISSVGRQGDGPGEFRGIWILDQFPGRRDGFLYDYTLRRVTEIDVDSLESGRLAVKKTWPLEANIGSLFPLANGDWYTTNASTRTLSQRFSPKTGAFTNLPLGGSGIPGKDSLFLQTAYEARGCGTLAGKIAIAFRYAAWVTIIDIDSMLEHKATAPVEVMPKFVDNPVAGPRMLKNGMVGVRPTYKDCTSDSHSIFALFSGRAIGKFDRSRISYGRYVHQFDWSGKLVRVIKLDHDALSLAVNDTTLFTLGIDSASMPAIWKQRIDRTPQ